jgi:hypothetical protein
MFLMEKVIMAILIELFMITRIMAQDVEDEEIYRNMFFHFHDEYYLPYMWGDGGEININSSRKIISDYS